MNRVNLPKWFTIIGVISLVFWIDPALAQQNDPHKLYEQSCAGCHNPHAGEFVFENLVSTDNGLVGRKSGKSVHTFLEAGHGGLSPSAIELMVEHLSNIKKSGRLFHDKCKICHVQAVKLARRELVLRDGTLVGRYSGREIGQFLTNHGRLKSTEVSIMTDVLKRQLTFKPTQ